ncbi:GNAT family N-acetyltransferase [Thermoflavimicrobium daqui]|nr:GNAT family N-acetyltransferase [Thermoflavimicrobium daqui]
MHIEYHQPESLDEIQDLRGQYLHTLVAPMDGMWESSIIAHATYWKIKYEGHIAGYFCIDSTNCLLQFYLTEAYQSFAQGIFPFILKKEGIKRAIVSTLEPFYLSLCLDFHRNLSIHSYLFRDSQMRELSFPQLKDTIFKQAKKEELEEVVRFYEENTEGNQDWIPPFVERLINQSQLFVLRDHQKILGTGECIISQKQKPYADLGMIVAKNYRKMGIGTYILIQLKNHCYNLGYKPICSCTFENIASKRAIEKAGFISHYRILNITF